MSFSEVQASRASSLPPSKGILFLGDKESGKLAVAPLQRYTLVLCLSINLRHWTGSKVVIYVYGKLTLMGTFWRCVLRPTWKSLRYIAQSSRPSWHHGHTVIKVVTERISQSSQLEFTSTTSVRCFGIAWIHNRFSPKSGFVTESFGSNRTVRCTPV